MKIENVLDYVHSCELSNSIQG